MIIVKLMGGLGNQLFQYAFARNIAITNELEVKLDVYSGFNKDYYNRKYELNYFCTKECIVRKDEVPKFVFENTEEKTLIGKFKRTINKVINTTGYKLVTDMNYNIDTVLDKKLNYYFNGYWQSEKYLTNISENIKKELKIKQKYLTTNALEREIEETESVALHFRNYSIHNAKDSKIYSLCDEKYYKGAIEYINSKLSNYKVFVFSDDLRKAKEIIKGNSKLVFVENVPSAINEFYLMSHCKHQIIANSTFSWWSAWLNGNINKIVIYPNDWFISKNTDEKLFPNNWIKI